MKRRLSAILFYDVVGYSRSMHKDESATIEAIKDIRKSIIDPQAELHNGRTIQVLGDGGFMEFASAVDATRFAVAMQTAVAERNTGLPEQQRLVFRIGINIGDVGVDGDFIYGDGVNIAARLEALAEPGGICVHQSVRDQMRGKLDLDFEDIGKIEVKNIAQPVHAFHVTLNDKVAVAAAKPVEEYPPRSQNSHRWITATGIIAVIVLIAGVVWWQPWTPRNERASVERMAFALPDVPSVAVLPFSNISDDKTQEYFADGLTEDLITDLSKVSGLFVIARNSTFAYKGKSVKINQVAEALGVRYVLEGSVRRAGDALRVNAQLIDTKSGLHVWADRYDGDVVDIFAVQDQIVVKIVSALQLKLTDAERSEISKSDTRKVDAKSAFQQGWDLYSRFNEQDNAKSVPYFEKAIELDPDYGRAYGALALVYLRGSFFNWDQALGEQEANLRHVLAPKLLRKAEERGTGLVHIVRAMQHLFYRHSSNAKPETSNSGTDDARREAGAAIAAQPNDPEAHVMMAWALIAAGKPEEGLNFITAAKRLNPNYPSHYVFFEAAARFAMGDLESSAAILRQGIERNPRAIELKPMAASVYASLGLRKEAKATIEEWQPNTTDADLDFTIAHYSFPIKWVSERQSLNTKLIDGLRLAAIPLDETVLSLMNGLDELNKADQVQNIRKLGWFGPTAAPSIALLIKSLGSKSKQVRREATISLGKIGPAALAALPALKASIDEPIIGFHAIAAIEKIGGGLNSPEQ